MSKARWYVEWQIKKGATWSRSADSYLSAALAWGRISRHSRRDLNYRVVRVEEKVFVEPSPPETK